jgi:hypothetical protein
MDVLATRTTNLSQAKVSNEKLQESLSEGVTEQEVSTTSTADTVTLSQEGLDASNGEIPPLASHAGGVYVPPKP